MKKNSDVRELLTNAVAVARDEHMKAVGRQEAAENIRYELEAMKDRLDAVTVFEDEPPRIGEEFVPDPDVADRMARYGLEVNAQRTPRQTYIGDIGGDEPGVIAVTPSGVIPDVFNQEQIDEDEEGEPTPAPAVG